MKSVVNKNHLSSNLFNEFGWVYFQTNEELKGYIKKLNNKSVLSVSASGDQLLNCVFEGASIVDTFDINYFSYLFQNLKISALKYLDNDDIFKYFCSFSFDIYRKFSDSLSEEVKSFFDYLYNQYDIDIIMSNFFNQGCTSIMKPEENIYKNNYINDLDRLRNNIMYLKNRHYRVDIYELLGCLDRKYDVIFLSNISCYCQDPIKFFRFLDKLSLKYLNCDGYIYYAYNYDNHFINPMLAIRSINTKFDIFYSQYKNNKLYKNILENTDIINLDGKNHNSVLRLHK